MTKVRLLALLAVVALVLFPAIAFAQPPQIPGAFHGTVLVNGQNVPDGTIISAKIGNETYTATTSDSTYIIVIAQPEGKSYGGLTVTFMIGSDTASQTGTWQMGPNVALNLTKGTPGTTPPPGGTCCITNAQLGNTTGVSDGTLTINQNAITGAAGAIGPAGPTGPEGPAGKSASSIIGIIAIVLAVIAICVAGVAMLRPRRA